MRWTREEEERLRELASTHTFPELAEIFHRDYKAVSDKARRMGIVKKAHEGEYYWSPKDDEKLRRNVRHLGIDRVAALIGRSRRAVLEHCRSLGICMRPELWPPDKVERFKADYPNMDNLDLMEVYDLPSIRHVASRAKTYGVRKSPEFRKRMYERRGWRIKDVLSRPEIRAKMERTMWKKGCDVGKDHKFGGKRHITPEEHAKSQETRRKTVARERRNMDWGLPRETKLRLRMKRR